MTPLDPSIGVVLLAAGQSARFDGNKLTSTFRGKPLWHWAAEVAEQAGFQTRYIVKAQNSPLQCREHWAEVLNPLADNGMGTSLAAGAKAGVRCERLVVILADMPFVSAPHLRRLAQGAGVIFTRYRAGRNGCPAAFPKSAFSSLQSLSADEGARRLELPETQSLAPETPEMLADLDTIDDFARYENRPG